MWTVEALPLRLSSSLGHSKMVSFQPWLAFSAPANVSVSTGGIGALREEPVLPSEPREHALPAAHSEPQCP